MLMEVFFHVMVPNMTQCTRGMFTFRTHFFTHGVTFHFRGVLDPISPTATLSDLAPLKASLMHCNFTLAEPLSPGAKNRSINVTQLPDSGAMFEFMSV